MTNRIVFILAFLFLFTGCGNKSTKVSESPMQKDTEVENSVIDTYEEKTEEIESNREVEEKDLVTEQYSNEGSYELKYGEEDEGYEYEFKYHIPEINDDSDDAKSINAEIFNVAKESIEVVEKMVSKESDFPDEPDFMDIGYKSYVNGDVLSIIVEAHSVYSDWVEYYPFNYNTNTKKRIENKELLSIAGLSEDEFLSRARNTLGGKCLENLDYVMDNYDNSESENDEDEENDPEAEEWKNRVVADFIQYYTQTVSDENISPDMKMYFDEYGDLAICGLVSVPAGAGQYYCCAKLSKTTDNVLVKYDEYIRKCHYDGFERDCLGLYDLEGYSGTVIRNATAKDEYEEGVYIGFSDVDPSMFLMQFNGNGTDMAYSGTLNWISADENGLAFEYRLTELNFKKIPKDKQYSGRFYLQPYGHYDVDRDEYISGAYYKYIDGDDMLGTDGEKLTLEKSYG